MAQWNVGKCVGGIICGHIDTVVGNSNQKEIITGHATIGTTIDQRTLVIIKEAKARIVLLKLQYTVESEKSGALILRLVIQVPTSYKKEDQKLFMFR